MAISNNRLAKGITTPELAKLLGVPFRQVRYATEVDIVKEIPHDGTGNRRKLSNYEAMALAVACYTRAGGVSLATVRLLISLLPQRVNDPTITVEAVPGVKIVVDLAMIRKKLGIESVHVDN